MMNLMLTLLSVPMNLHINNDGDERPFSSYGEGLLFMSGYHTLILSAYTCTSIITVLIHRRINQ